MIKNYSVMNLLRNTRIVFVLLVGLLSVGFAGCGGDDRKAVDERNEQYASEALSNLKFRMEATNRASEYSTDSAIQVLVDTLFKRQEDAYARLAKMIDEAGWQVSEEVESTRQQDLVRMSDFGGSDFDQLYVDLMIRSYEEAIERYSQTREGTDEVLAPPLREFVADELPKLEADLEHLGRMRAIVQTPDEVQESDNDEARHDTTRRLDRQ